MKRKNSIQSIENKQPDSKRMRHIKREKIQEQKRKREDETESIQPDSKKMRQLRMQKIKQKKRKIEKQNNLEKEQIAIKQRCLNISHRHSYLTLPHGMVLFPSEYIQHLKETYNGRSYLGIPKYNCKYCNAIFWFHEQNKYDTKHNKGEIMYSNCCKYGEIKIPAFKDPPEFLARLLDHREGPLAKHFIQKIRQYNSLFAFTSMGANIDKNINQGNGPYVFRINRQIHHRIGSLLPQPDTIPKFAELYIFDTKNEIQNRIRALSNEDPEENDINPYIVEQLKNMLDQHNPLVKTFRHARDLLEEHKSIDVSIRIIGANKGDPIQYEMPHTEDLAMLVAGELNLENYRRDIIVNSRYKGLKRISIFHPAYMPLQYPLLFPYGER